MPQTDILWDYLIYKMLALMITTQCAISLIAILSVAMTSVIESYGGMRVNAVKAR